MMAASGKALITGVTGQDGSYLAELLLRDGMDVIGTRRDGSVPWQHHRNLHDAQRIASETGRTFDVIDVDLTSTADVASAVKAVAPTCVFNLAAQTHVGSSFSRPEYTLNVTGVGAARVIDAAIEHAPRGCRIYQASTSEMFGGTECGKKLSSTSPFNPRSPYAAAKLMAHQIALLHRNRGAFVSCGILFNHESERRGEQFVTRKITSSLAAIKLGHIKRFSLGMLSPKRDWGYAPDYVVAMHDSLCHSEPVTFVLGTGTSRSVGQFLQTAMRCAGFAEGTPIDEIVDVDASAQRPLEVMDLVADESEARRLFGWRPMTSFETMVERMVEHDIKELRCQ
jgi:GDPmannose 4,6-dehydratase